MNTFIHRFGYPLKYLMAIKGCYWGCVELVSFKLLGLVPLLRRPTDPHTPTIVEPRWRATSYVPVQSEGCLLRPGVLVAEVKIIILPSPVERTKVREVLMVERSWNIREDGSQPLRW